MTSVALKQTEKNPLYMKVRCHNIFFQKTINANTYYILKSFFSTFYFQSLYLRTGFKLFFNTIKNNWSQFSITSPRHTQNYSESTSFVTKSKTLFLDGTLIYCVVNEKNKTKQNKQCYHAKQTQPHQLHMSTERFSHL